MADSAVSRVHINDNREIKPCDAKVESRCHFLRHFASVGAAEAYLNTQNERISQVKSGKVDRDPYPVVTAPDQPWTHQDKLVALEAAERLLLVEESLDDEYRNDARIARLETYVWRIQRIKNDGSDDEHILKVLANELIYEEHSYREQSYYCKTQREQAVRDYLDLHQDITARNPEREGAMPKTAEWLATFHTDEAPGVSMAEMNTIRFLYAREDEQQAQTEGRERTSHYHVNRAERHVIECDEPRCEHRPYYASYAQAREVANQQHELKPWDKKKVRDQADQYQHPEVRNPNPTGQFQHTMAMCAEHDGEGSPTHNVMAYLAQRSRQPFGNPATHADLVKQLRAVESESVRRTDHRAQAIIDARQAVRMYPRTLLWTKRLAETSDDPDTIKTMGTLHELLAANPPSATITKGQCTPAILRLVDDEIFAHGGPRAVGKLGPEYKPWEPGPTRSQYEKAVATYFKTNQAPKHGYVMIDTEVTDLSTSHGDIIEVGLAYMDPTGKPLHRASWVAQSEGPNGYAGLSSLHRLDKTMVANGVTQQASAQELARMIDGWVPVAHNARFDKQHVDRLLDRHGHNRTGPWLDTMCMYSGLTQEHKITPTVEGKGLKAMTHHYDFAFGEDHHAASSDVTAAGFCFQRMAAHYNFGIPFTEPAQAPTTSFEPSTITRGGNQVEADEQLWQTWVTSQP